MPDSLATAFTTATDVLSGYMPYIVGFVLPFIIKISRKYIPKSFFDEFLPVEAYRGVVAVILALFIVVAAGVTFDLREVIDFALQSIGMSSVTYGAYKTGQALKGGDPK